MRGWWLIPLGLLAGCRSAPDDGAPPSPPAPAPRAEPAPVVRNAPRVASRTSAVRVARTPEDAWKRARPFDAAARRELLSFFSALTDAQLAHQFGVTRATLPEQGVAARLQRETFAYQAVVAWTPTPRGVFVQADGAARPSVRLVWPIDVGGGLELTPHKPRVNAGTGSPVLRRHASWLFDLDRDREWLKNRSESAPPLRFRALLQPRGARVERHPVLVVRVVAWQVLDGSSVLHEETDDR